MMINYSLDILHHQYKVLSSTAKVTSMSCGRGAGKTSTLCLAAIRDMMAGKKVLIVEPIIQQFRSVLAPELNAMLVRMGIFANFNKSFCTWKYGSGEIITVSAEAQERFRGVSEVSTLLLDECGSYDEMTFNLARPTMRGLTVIDPKIYLFSTATPKGHWFAKRSLKEGTNLIYATSAENLFNGKDYFKDLCRDYEGLPDDFIQRELYGRFTDFSENTIFKTLAPHDKGKTGIRAAGVDLALGGDYTAFVMFDGNILAAMEKKRTPTPEDAYAFIQQMCTIYKPIIVSYDCTGHGSYAEVGKYTNGVSTNPINFAMAGGMYADMRTKIYFDLRLRLKDFAVGVEQAKYDELVEDLKATTLDDKERMKPKLIKKEEIEKLLGRSPDYGDAAAMAAITFQNIDYGYVNGLQIRNNPFRK
jgi:hypothetical protein